MDELLLVFAPLPGRNNLGYAALLALAIASVLALDLVILPFYSPPGGSGPLAHSCSSSQSGPYLNLSQVYVCLGYPIVHGYPSDLTSPVINLTAALASVKTSGALASSLQNQTGIYYNLIEAKFSLGTPPTWDLYFARAYQGFWFFGYYDVLDASAVVIVNALDASIVSVSIPSYPPMPVPAPGTRYEIDVNESQALQIFRAMAPTQEVPAGLISGNVALVQPMIVLFGPSSNNAAFYGPTDPSLAGTERLCWVIEASSATPGYGYQGTFAVDAVTGQIDSAWAIENLPTLTTT